MSPKPVGALVVAVVVELPPDAMRLPYSGWLIRAAAPSVTLGISIVWPATTCASTGKPLNAATVRVVRLLAAEIDQRVSPALTVCGTAAPALGGSPTAIPASSIAPMPLHRMAPPLSVIGRSTCFGRLAAPPPTRPAYVA